MEIDEKMAGPVLVLALAGRLDSNTAPDLEQALPTRIGQHPATIVDLSQVGYVSSAGLRIILIGAKTARSPGPRMVLSGLAPSVNRMSVVPSKSVDVRMVLGVHRLIINKRRLMNELVN